MDSDLVNKPNQVVVGKFFSRKKAWILYAVLVTLSIVFAVLSIHSNVLPIIVTVFFNFLLFLYSIKLKSLPFIGNVAVALIIAFIPAYALLYDIPTSLYQIDEDTYEFMLKDSFQEKFNSFIFFFMEMAFFINLTREILKDIIDVDGDNQVKIKTLPIIFGKTRMGYFVSFLLVVLTWLILVHPIFEGKQYSKWYFIIGTLPLLLLSIIMILRSNYKQASLSLKIAMFIALMYLPIFHFAFHHHDA